MGIQALYMRQMDLQDINTVSYTHLDVYKRQDNLITKYHSLAGNQVTIICLLYTSRCV